jgi:hypothetical protein
MSILYAFCVPFSDITAVRKLMKARRSVLFSYILSVIRNAGGRIEWLILCVSFAI